jgi:hypothetical protein
MWIAKMKRPFQLIAACLFVFFLTACNSSLVNDLFTRSGERYFWDDFSDQSAKWPNYTDSNGTIGYLNNAYRISVTTTNYEMWALSGHNFKDARVEVDTAGLGGPEQNLFGVICRARDNSNYYFFVISGDSYYAIGKINNRVVSLIGQKMMTYSPSIFPGRGTNHLRFDCVGDTLTGYVNGRAVAMVQDADFSEGDVGLLAGTFDTPGVEVSFDNFEVYKP